MDSDNFKIDFGHIWLPIEKMQKCFLWKMNQHMLFLMII